jgi:hypothetical protein
MKARFTPLIGVGLGILVAGSLVLLSLLAQKVTLQPPSSPSVAPVHPWRQPGGSVSLELREGPGGPIATLLEQSDRTLRLGPQPNRLLRLVAQAQSEVAQSVSTTPAGGSGIVVALADGGPSATGPVSEGPVETGAPPERPRDRGPDSGGGGPTPSDEDDDKPARRDDEDEEEPPDDSEDDDDRDDYASEDSDDSGSGSVAAVRMREQDFGDDDDSGSDSDS